MAKHRQRWGLIETMEDGDVCRTSSESYAYLALVWAHMRAAGCVVRIIPVFVRPCMVRADLMVASLDETTYTKREPK